MGVFLLFGIIFSYFLQCGTVDPNLVTESKIPKKIEVIPKPKGDCRRYEKDPDDQEFRIAWLAPEKEYHNFSARTSVGAMKLALAYIRQHHHLGNVRAKWYDSNCDSKQAMESFVNAVEEYDPDVVIGPPCSAGLLGVAQLGSIWNLPVFSWVSDLLDFKDRDKYTTLVRLSGPLHYFSEIVRQTSLYFNWTDFALINDKQAPYEAVAVALRDSSRGQSYNIKSTNYVTEGTTDSEIQSMLLQIKKFARVIIFVVPWHMLRHYLLIAHKLGMANGEWAFLCVHGDLFTLKVIDEKIVSDWGWRRNDTQDEIARTIFESVIHIIMEPVVREDHYENFLEFAKQAAVVNVSAWDIPFNHTELDAYAPYLYDAMLTWADCVNYTMQRGGNPRDGKHIYNIVPKAVTSRGVTGAIVFDEPERNRMLNYRILDMRDDGTFYTLYKFIFIDNKEMKYHYDDLEKFEQKGRWPTKNGVPPANIPVCGYEGEMCVVEDYQNNYNGTIIGASVSASVVLMLAIVVHMMLRRYRRQMTLQSMLWQVRFDEIDFVTALMTGSIRNSFKNLSKRKPSSKTLKRRRINVTGLPNMKSITENGKKGSPEITMKALDSASMFGSVAFVRGNLTSVKRMQIPTLNLTNCVLQQLNQITEIKHQNLCPFVGACLEPNRFLLLWEYCAKGSLQDVIWNQNIKLDQMFMFALSHDVAKGLELLHKSAIHFHGNLRSTNCVVDSRWTCKLTDFGVPTIREMEKVAAQQANKDPPWEKLQWMAPECLREERKEKCVDRQKVDIYALGIILKEVFTRSGPYSEYPFLESNEIVEKIKCHVKGERPFRPMLSLQLRQHTELTSLIEDCWSEDPSSRPNANRVLKQLNKINPQNLNMIDNMIVMLEKYANHLEDLVAERTSELDAEKAKTENLLYRMLPQTVAEELKLGRPIKAEHFDESTLYFSDIVGFTSICSNSTPIEVVNLLNSLYTLFDDIITRYDVYKVETIGDAYMIASGLPKRNGKKHIQEVADCALDILASISTFCIPHQPDQRVRIRVGIHSGPVVAGVVGLAMPRYCLFGDTVNTASRMESTGLPLRIHLSSHSKEALDAYPGYHLICRGEVAVKGKGHMRTYLLCGRDGFKKELPYSEQYDNCENLNFRASVTSLNSMASLISGASSSFTTCPSLEFAHKASQVSTFSEDLDEKYKSKQTSILEVTCL
ncbi:ANPRA-like protein [Mya arenaria]|uniref:Guanylate cyclase n=1 Tax=Mya arenaria TaxID=6604 RepID=A0ABY7DYP0_MYAAR|nr:atrial natriuretic peptide receptor 1-like [Mya arenaria]WAR01722.1 ANPRA-like protein [Mya arenaria]